MPTCGIKKMAHLTFLEGASLGEARNGHGEGPLMLGSELCPGRTGDQLQMNRLSSKNKVERP